VAPIGDYDVKRLYRALFRTRVAPVPGVALYEARPPRPDRADDGARRDAPLEGTHEGPEHDAAHRPGVAQPLRELPVGRPLALCGVEIMLRVGTRIIVGQVRIGAVGRALANELKQDVEPDI